MNYEDLLIKTENERFAVCLLLDDHKAHLRAHLKYIWKPRIAKHIFDHLCLMCVVKRLGIPRISLEDVLSGVKELKK